MELLKSIEFARGRVIGYDLILFLFVLMLNVHGK